MYSRRIRSLTMGAMIAALYVLLTVLAGTLNLASGAVQLRFSEALCILPYFTPVAIPGLFIGCLLSNLLLGSAVWDVLFGSLATLLGALGTYALRRFRFLTPLPPILANTVIIPCVIAYTTMPAENVTPAILAYFALTVGAGEVLSCAVLGLPLQHLLNRYRHILFPAGPTGSGKASGEK